MPYILEHFDDKSDVIDNLLNPILIGLRLIRENRFDFITIQSLIINILPILAEVMLKNLNNENLADTRLHYNVEYLQSGCEHYLEGFSPVRSSNIDQFLFECISMSYTE